MNTILIIEPESVLLELLAELLELNGLDPLTTTSFEQGYELTKREKPQLILCGHSSKYINSYEECWKFLHKIRQEEEIANIPFIFMAGSDLSTIPDWHEYLTHEQVLLKPFNSQSFIQKIYSHLPNNLQNHSKKNHNTKINTAVNPILETKNDLVTQENRTTHKYRYLFA
jgi:CheY-like chemotaxis protein